jgi:hypothetical protein
LGGFAVALLLHPPKSDDKNSQEMFNWSELHSKEVTPYKIGTLHNDHSKPGKAFNMISS